MIFDIGELEKDKSNGKYLNVASVATFINNINRMFKTIEGKVDDYQIYYRGHESVTFQEIPSIFRTDDIGNPWIEKEDRLCDEIIRECPHDFDDHTSVFDKLVKMQHYELPTRLLDISENPLVALYFACLSTSETKDNGEILIYFVPKNEIISHTNPIVEAISGISFIAKDALLKGKGNVKELARNLSVFTSHLPYLDDCNKLNDVLCVRARKSNPRIIRQQGAFFLFGAKDADKTQMPALKYKPFKMEISYTGKKKILNELERYGISEKTLFPEIDKVAHHLKTH